MACVQSHAKAGRGICTRHLHQMACCDVRSACLPQCTRPLREAEGVGLGGGWHASACNVEARAFASGGVSSNVQSGCWPRHICPVGVSNTRMRRRLSRRAYLIIVTEPHSPLGRMLHPLHGSGLPPPPRPHAPEPSKRSSCSAVPRSDSTVASRHTTATLSGRLQQPASSTSAHTATSGPGPGCLESMRASGTSTCGTHTNVPTQPHGEIGLANKQRSPVAGHTGVQCRVPGWLRHQPRLPLTPRSWPATPREPPVTNRMQMA